MRRRSSTLELASFFEPFELHLQEPDLFEQFLLAREFRGRVGQFFGATGAGRADFTAINSTSKTSVAPGGMPGRPLSP